MARRAAVLVAPPRRRPRRWLPWHRFQQARQRTVVQESFGFDFAEDQAENTDLTTYGEAAQGGFIRSYKPTATF